MLDNQCLFKTSVFNFLSPALIIELSFLIWESLCYLRPVILKLSSLRLYCFLLNNNTACFLLIILRISNVPLFSLQSFFNQPISFFLSDIQLSVSLLIKSFHLSHLLLKIRVLFCYLFVRSLCVSQLISSLLEISFKTLDLMFEIWNIGSLILDLDLSRLIIQRQFLW